MAYEADVLREASALHDVVYYTIADATAVAKGTLMDLSEGATRTVTVHDHGSDSYPAGFAVTEKEANDGQTEIGVQKSGLVWAYADDTIDEADLIVPGTGVNNQCQAAPTTTLLYSTLMRIMGRAESAASANGGFWLRLRL